MSEFDPKAFLATLSTHPGVYRMLNSDGEILYVGKARNLKNRVSSYFSGKPQSAKTMAMVQQICGIEVTITASDTEALLLEYNLIKKHKPRYNVLLRDDKSFPYLHVATQQEFPRISFYRGSRKMPGKFFGPYPSASATRETLALLQKLFRLRPCEDTFFANRSRPCLQYQIKRCSGPCVGLVTQDAYAQDVQDAIKVLEGQSSELIGELAQRMEQAATELSFERAARLRDQINAIKAIQSGQVISKGEGDYDAVALATDNNQYCVAVVFVRGGRNLGSANFFPKAGMEEGAAVLSGFIAQYYLSRAAPAEILLDTTIEDADILATTLSERVGRTIEIRSKVRGVRARTISMALMNAGVGLRMRIADRASVGAQLQALQTALGLSATPMRLECFDISHTMGEATVASCVVFGTEGPIKSDYRRFNIEGLAPGDDYGAMKQALQRRYARVKRGEVAMPDVLLVDGGPNQLAQVTAVLAELQMDVSKLGITLIGVAKGPDRRAGQERLFLALQELPTILPADSIALHLIQRIRDEAHRFAITGHRQRRAKGRRESILESIPGLGPRKRRELLRHFGGWQGITRASIDDLSQAHGIGPQLAEAIFESLHPSG
jgi:excinuclease ABC subunit C